MPRWRGRSCPPRGICWTVSMPPRRYGGCAAGRGARRSRAKRPSRGSLPSFPRAICPPGSIWRSIWPRSWPGSGSVGSQPRRGETCPKRQTRLERRSGMTLPEMLQGLPRAGGRGNKRNAQGWVQEWTGYRLHVDATEGGIPVASLLTSASLHDKPVNISNRIAATAVRSRPRGCRREPRPGAGTPRRSGTAPASPR